MKCPKCETVNSPDSHFCKKCATPLPKAVDDQISFTKTLETTAPGELVRGSVFAGRYEIIEELGAGGMGRVYRAFDKKIEEEVALKLVRPEIAADRKTTERFRNELKTARKIRHASVCAMHDLHEEGKTLFITMEYVRGEDLKSLIHRTKTLPPGTALAIARQIAEGLAEAHKLGVVHRDLKPSNIMVDKDGNAKIMDFGIARTLTRVETTVEGAVIGTPEYMSPEQVEGKAADSRADIYALGVILFEMVTGRAPFEGDTAFSIANKHKSAPAPDPREFNAQLPVALAGLILRCLEKGPEKRFQKAEELLDALTRIEQEIPLSERARPVAKRRPITSREITVTFGMRKAALTAGAVVVLAALVVFVWKPWKGKQSDLPSTGNPRLAVLNFENTSRDESLDDWKTGIPLLLTTDLSQSKYLSVLSYDQVFGVLKSLNLEEASGFSSDDLDRFARQGHAAFTVTGGIMRAGERVIVVLSVRDQSTGETKPAKFECAGEAEIPSLVDRMTVCIKELMGFSRSQVSGDLDALTVDITTKSPEAFRLYNEGRRAHLAGHPARAAELMRSAIEKDPGFALAFRGLSAALGETGRREERKAHLRKAFDLRGNTSVKERFWIEADYYGISELTQEKALEVCKNWLSLYPEDAYAMHRIGRLYLDIEDYGQAIRYLEMSIHKGSQHPYTTLYLVVAYHLSGAHGAGERAAQLGLSALPENFVIEESVFDCYISQGKIKEAGALIERQSSRKPRPSSGLKAEDLLIVQGRYDEAYEKLAQRDPAELLVSPTDSQKYSIPWRELCLSLAEGRLEQARGVAGKLANHWMSAYISYQKGDYARALSEAQSALRDARDVGSLRGQAWALQLRGQIELAMDSAVAAGKTADELESCVRASSNKKLIRHYHFLMGTIESYAGKPIKAIDHIRKAIDSLPGESWTQEVWWHAIFYEALAKAFFRSGELEKAKVAYRKIQSLALARLGCGDIYAVSFYWLGRIAELQNHRGEAGQQLRRFLDLWKNADPGVAEVEDAKKRLAGLSQVR